MREWALPWMDPLNAVLFDMKEDGGHPQEIATVLITRAAVELAMHGMPKGEVETELWMMVQGPCAGCSTPGWHSR